MTWWCWRVQPLHIPVTTGRQLLSMPISMCGYLFLRWINLLKPSTKLCNCSKLLTWQKCSKWLYVLFRYKFKFFYVLFCSKSLFKFKSDRGTFQFMAKESIRVLRWNVSDQRTSGNPSILTEPVVHSSDEGLEFTNKSILYHFRSKTFSH